MAILKGSTFKWALLLSLFIHIFIFIKVPAFRINTYQKVREILEVTYNTLVKTKDSQEPQPQIADSKNIPYTQELTKDIPLPSLENIIDLDLLTHKKDRLEKTPITLVDSDKKINIAKLESDIPKSQAYEAYIGKLRENIRKRLYANYAKLNRYQEGNAYVSFVVLRNGVLKEIKIQEDKSDVSAHLQEIVLKSFREASPFEVFSKELDYPQIPFSVTVTFEVENR